jgi:hypothetical protein
MYLMQRLLLFLKFTLKVNRIITLDCAKMEEMRIKLLSIQTHGVSTFYFFIFSR